MSETLPNEDELTTLAEESETPAAESEPDLHVETPNVIDKEIHDKTVKGFQRKIAQLQDVANRSAIQQQELEELRRQLREVRYQNYPQDEAANLRNQELENELAQLRAERERDKAVREYYRALDNLEEEYPEGAKFAREMADDGDFLPVQTLEDLERKVKRYDEKFKGTTAPKAVVLPSNPAETRRPQEELSDEEFAKLSIAEQRAVLGAAELPY